MMSQTTESKAFLHNLKLLRNKSFEDTNLLELDEELIGRPQKLKLVVNVITSKN